MKAIIPKRLNAQQIARAVTNTLNGAAIAVQVDLQTTTATWKTRVGFDIQTPSEDRRIVGTDNQIYQYVNDGTRPHDIVPRNARRLRFQSGYSAKTSVGVIGSRGGGPSGGVVYARKVRHPGTAARNFTQAVARKWEAQLAIQMQAAINAELS